MRFSNYLLLILTGIIFGVFDWHFTSFAASLTRSNILKSFVLIWGIWLVPAIPFALYVAKKTHSLLSSALAVVILWLAAIFAYYAYYTFQLAFIGLNQMEHLLVFGPRSELFWQDWSSTFQMLIMNQMTEWSIVAIIGGSIVGGVVGHIYLLYNRKLSSQTV
ncbi:MAG: hypothetical protein GFH27_549281n289 [Chloroflexi bacterium AL-W]|nr:hypothetical protein [Chloroflexi bacterium AL-N1]NOK66174.1 hypothetical protein [Chloroflexi bacterium AL-N10]NOK73055.1 hypothetical protein [Chloroflexi bacterium AL-N5]NOK79952.1 hypothetical protein [Chloroflexi bacterium AL-W]NOK88192.1 hypothetical protein [Chloroflexi bacterium AL-N15]